MFRDKIPEKILETSTVSNLIDVLDGVQEYKTESINKALRVYNPVLSLDKKWLIKQLEEYGVTTFPEALPMETLVQFMGNISTIMELRGSKLGVEFLCSILTFGEVVVDDSAYYCAPKLLLLDSLNSALLVGASTDAYLHLAANTDDLKDFKTVDITISSYLWNVGGSVAIQTALASFLEGMLRKYVPFSDSPTINITYTGRVGKFLHSQLNSFLV